MLAARAEAADYYYAIYSTAGRDGLITLDDGFFGGCPPASPSLNKTGSAVNSTVFYVHALLWYVYNRGFYSFDLTNVAGVVDSARVKLVLETKTFGPNDSGPDAIFSYGDCEIGTTCSNDLVGADTNACANSLITIPWADLPTPLDTLYLSVSSAQIPDVGSGHTFDLRMISSRESILCGFGGQNYTSTIAFKTVEEDTVSLRPVLYVWSHDVAAAKPAIVDIDASDIDLSNPQFIRRESD